MSESETKSILSADGDPDPGTQNFDFLTDSTQLAKAIESFFLEEAEGSTGAGKVPIPIAGDAPSPVFDESFTRLGNTLQNSAEIQPGSTKIDDPGSNLLNLRSFLQAVEPPKAPQQNVKNGMYEAELKSDRTFVRQEVSVAKLFELRSEGRMNDAAEFSSREIEELKGRCRMYEIQVAMLQAKIREPRQLPDSLSRSTQCDSTVTDDANVALMAQQRIALEAITIEMAKTAETIGVLREKCQRLEEAKLAGDQLLETREQQLEAARFHTLQLEARIRELEQSPEVPARIPVKETPEKRGSSSIAPLRASVTSEIYPSPGFAQGKLLSRLEAESSRLTCAEDRIRQAQEKSQTSLAAAVSKLQALEKARVQAEARAAELEERVTIVNKSIDSIPTGVASAALRTSAKSVAPSPVKMDPVDKSIAGAMAKTSTDTPIPAEPTVEKSVVNEKLPLKKASPTYEQHLLEVARQDRLERNRKAREQRQRQNRSSWSLTDMQPPWDVVNKPAPEKSLSSTQPQLNLGTNPANDANKPTNEKENREASAPFATNASSKRIDAGFSLLERKLLMTNIEIGDAEAKLGRLMNKRGRTRSSIEMRNGLEERLQELRQQASNIRIALKSQPK